MGDAGRWARVTAVFQEALERDEAARAAYLDVACAGDPGLRAEVESLLSAHFAAGDFAKGSPIADLPSSVVENLGDDAVPSTPSLASGTRLGPYEIVEPISAGGMGELFRARDTRLGRDVAIKVPFASVSNDPARRQRFQREGRAIATLNHPHICTVHDVGSDSGVDYLVLELLQGETLAARLKRGALPVDEAITRASEIAEALARAHREGIVHRDLKPGNVMLTPSGVKVLDFGLARITRGDTDAPMSAEPLSGRGALLGTVQYMAPEQLQGRVADARSDIYAFGATLFEMVTGKRAFESFNAERPELPPALDRLLGRCLAREPEARFESLHDVAVALQWARDDMHGSNAADPNSRRRVIAIGAAIAACVLVAGVASWTMFGRRATDAATVRFSIQPPPMPFPVAFAVSPDGQTIAFAAAPPGTTTTMLFLRPVGAIQARALPGTEGATAPFWSPDSQHVGFVTQKDRKLKTVAAAGGEPVAVCDIVRASETFAFGGASWSRDGVILFSTSGRPSGSNDPGPGFLLYRVAATGGVPSLVGALDRAAGETGHSWPFFLPDGRRFVYMVAKADPTQRAIVAGSLDSSDRTPVMSTESMAVPVSPGYLLFTKQQRLFAQRFDTSTLQVAGEPMALADDELLGGTRPAFSASSQTLVYRSRATGSEETGVVYSLAWVERDGRVSVPFRETFNLSAIRLAPDATRVAFFDRGTNTDDDIWIYDLDRDQKTLLANDTLADHNPLWSPDGSRIAFDRGPSENPNPAPHLLYEQRVDGALPPKFLLPPEPGVSYAPLDWTTKYLVFQYSFLKTRPRKPGEPVNFELWAQPTVGDRKPFRYVTGLAEETTAALSPNGRWLAYVDKTGGRQDLIVRSFPNPSQIRQVISTTGVCPRWRQDGKELYYLGPDGGVTSVSVATEGNFAVGKSERLFSVLLRAYNTRDARGPACPYDVRPDGQRFVVAQPGGANRDIPISVVLNWTADLSQ